MVAINHAEINITCGVIHAQPQYNGTAKNHRTTYVESLLLYYWQPCIQKLQIGCLCNGMPLSVNEL